MRIDENTPQRLVLSHRPLAMGLMVAGVGAVVLLVGLTQPFDSAVLRGIVIVLALALLYVAHWAFPVTRTVFDRPSGLMVHEERRLTGRRTLPLPLDQLGGAQVDMNFADSGGRLYRLTVLSGGRRIPLERGYRNADLRPVESAINEWLTRPV